MLDVRLLGTPEVTLDGKPVDVDTRKAIALLAYLSIERSSTRDTLATLLWADSSAERSRATLRRTLSSLRSGIGAEALNADRNQIALAEGANIDVASFAEAMRETTEHDHEPEDVCGRCIPALTRATGLYRGDFLEGFSVRDAPDFEDWARNVSESIRLRAGGAFNRLSMGLAAAGDYTGAVAAVKRWIELDELHEPAHRLLMLLNAWAGDRPGSVEAYRDFVAILDRELGVSPLDETTELYEAILDEDLPPAPGIRRRVKTEPIDPEDVRQDLLDRRTQLAALRAGLPSMGVGGRVIVVAGGSWMGKTRLIEEIVAEARLSSTHVFVGRAFRMEQELPYGVVTQLLRDLSLSIDAARAQIPPWATIELARLDPRIAPGEHPEETERFGELRLFEAAHATLAAIGSSFPVALVVDDIQWIDPASANLLSYLSRRIGDLPAVLILSHRTGEPVLEPIADMLRSAETIDLEPLTAADLGDRVSDPETASKVISRTGGVPLLALEAISGDIPETELTGVAKYIKSRLSEVGDLGHQVLSGVAVLTGVCDVALLREVSGRTEDEVVEAVEELIRAGLLRELPGGELLGFTLDALEKMLYDSLTLVRRRLLHRRAAEALESRPRSRTDARIAAGIAAQYRGAGDERAAEWYRIAGDLSREVYANAEARTFYEAAIALGGQDVASLHLALGELAMTSGDYQGALRELRAAASQAVNGMTGLVEHRLGEVNRLLGRFRVAGEHFAEAERTHPHPTELFADWALLLHRTGNGQDALRYAESAVSAATDHVSRSRASNVLGLVADDPGEAMIHFDQAIDLAGHHDLPRMAAINNKAHLLASIGNGAAAVGLVEEAIELASKTGHLHYEAALRNHLADLLHRQGSIEDSQKEQTKAMSLFAGVASDEWEPEVWLLSRW